MKIRCACVCARVLVFVCATGCQKKKKRRQVTNVNDVLLYWVSKIYSGNV